MLKIHYFASIREQLGMDFQELALPEGVINVAELIGYLENSNSRFKEVTMNKNKLLIAVNQTVVDRTCSLSSDDEVAFFPPMTGG